MHSYIEARGEVFEGFNMSLLGSKSHFNAWDPWPHHHSSQVESLCYGGTRQSYLRTANDNLASGLIIAKLSAMLQKNLFALWAGYAVSGLPRHHIAILGASTLGLRSCWSPYGRRSIQYFRCSLRCE